jgi:hypothetical protein
MRAQCDPHKAPGRISRTILWLLCFFVAVMGQAPNEPVQPKKDVSQAAVPAQPSGPHEMTAADLEAFLDGLVPSRSSMTTSPVSRSQ